MGTYLFTSESVSEGHPDKVADQISDAVLDQLLAYDAGSRVACETLVTTGLVVIAGEVSSQSYVDLQEVCRDTIERIGYTNSELQFDAKSCGVLSALHEQSPDINRGVDRGDPADQGAGDQGMMFGYATNETPAYMPLALYLSHRLMRTLSAIRKEGRQMPYLRPDAKCQVTVRYQDDGTPLAIDTIVLSTQHDPFINTGNASSDEAAMLAQISRDVRGVLLPRMLDELGDERIRALFDSDISWHINPTGLFVVGGPHGDTGLTGRKIIVDTYGGKGAHGGGAFSGKDPSKVDRSAAYAARHIAKNMVAAGVSDEMLVQICYAIGVADPVSVYVNTYGRSHVAQSDGELAGIVRELFTLRPAQIEARLQLRRPIYSETAAYGHVGREPVRLVKHFHSRYEGDRDVEVELFTWEKLDYVDAIRERLGLHR